MAAVYGVQPTKHKSVYGRKGARGYNTSHVNSFFGDDEDELSSTHPTIKSAYSVQNSEAKEAARPLKPANPRIKRQDTFDVPSSSDDDISPPAKRVSPLKPRSVVVDDTDTSGVQLFPWEKRSKQRTPPRRQSPTAKRLRTPEGSPEAQLKHELRSTLSPEASPRTPRLRKDGSQSGSHVISPDSAAELKSAGAAARLAARRKLLESNAPSSADERTKPTRAVPKRSVLASDESEDTPRKRPKTAVEKRVENGDVEMADADADVMCNMEQSPSNLNHDAGIYDFAALSEEETHMKPRPVPRNPKPVAKPSRRKQLQTYGARPSQKKGASAPSRLAEMVATDTDTTEPSTRSPSESPSLRSIQQLPSTSPSARIPSPDTAIKSAGTMTPKQAQLWDRLLPGKPAVPSPSALAMRDLTISGERRRAAPVAATARKLSKSHSDIPKRRPRLVDRLKASAPSSDVELDDERTDDVHVSDEEAMEHVEPSARDMPSMRRPQVSRSQSQMEAHSQSISQSQSGAGSLRTYGGGRTYLDDSIDDVMSGLTAETIEAPKQPSQSGKKSMLASQKSTFDLDDSDDDQAGHSQMRSIHELRAAGSLSRGMWEIEEALEEIKQHGQPQRGRRRTALMDLASKLADKTFATRFVGQSCEIQLVAECGAASDDTADFVIAAAIAFIMASEPSDHTVQGLRDHGVVSWLAQLLERDTQVSKMVRDRKNNMSKASQISLLQFCDMLNSVPTFWDEEKPQSMSARLIALRTLDIMTRRLRQAGDKSEILPKDAIHSVLSNFDPEAVDTAVLASTETDLALSISLLESLSTTSITLEWPPRTMEGIGTLLRNLETTEIIPQKSQFLLLRLCLNLTNENAHNCRLLTGSDETTIRALLTAIRNGYVQLANETDDEKRTITLDLLVLSIGISINLFDHSDAARSFALANSELLSSVVDTFQQGQKHMLDAESVEESISNVTFGYLAVMLANLCQDSGAKAFIASKSPGRDLSMLVEAVEEFVRHHQKVDTMNFDGEEGGEVWGAFTEKLRDVLLRLKQAEGASGV